MSVESFIDTNVFIYQLEGLDIRKAAIAERLIAQGIADKTACISFQVVQECLNTALCKAQTPLSTEDMRKYLQTVLAPLYRVQPNLPLYHSALDLQSRHNLAFHDSLIVAAALEFGCKRLYSENLQHGQRIGNLIIEDPFQDLYLA